MTDLVVRCLLIDLDAPLPRHWCEGDAFLTAFFNALSMSFPIGEQFFIDLVRDASKMLPPERQQQFDAEVKGFVGQEATHRRIHGLFNEYLYRQGLVNGWEPRAKKRIKLLEGLDKRHALAATAANEHFTAILADWLLRNHDLLDGCEPRLKTMWMWHASEESEHKCVAFDLYRALDGSHEWRIAWMRRVTFIFLSEALRQTLSNLWHDRTWWKWRTWVSAGRHLFGQRGLVREAYPAWREYFRDDFHPAQQDSELAREWLEGHQDAFRAVGSC